MSHISIKKIKKTGFTLIELLVVISIIALLSTIVFGYFNTAKAKLRDTVRASDMKQISTASEMYYQTKGVLPSSIGGPTNSLVSEGYLPIEPKDPLTGLSYSFTSGNEGKTIVVSGYSEINDQIVAAALGEVDAVILCSDVFASSTGCVDGVISGNIIGFTGGHRSGGSSTPIEESTPVTEPDNTPLTKQDYLTQSTCVENNGEWTDYPTGREECKVGMNNEMCTTLGGDITISCPVCPPGELCPLNACLGECTFNNGVPLPCSSFTYSSWSVCINNSQSRTVKTSSPAGCIGGSPITSQSCFVPILPGRLL